MTMLAPSESTPASPPPPPAAAPLLAAPEPAGSGGIAVAGSEPPTKRYRYFVLGILVLVYTMNFLDRQILAILKGPIQAELHVSDSVMGVMSGLTFALLYSTIGIPIASLADRSSRRKIMAWALGLWSLFTAVCGFAQNIWHLAAARIGVGIGEAGGVAPAYSMVSDYFPKNQRARALSIYSLGIPLGSAAGILFGGLIAKAISWRAAFIIVGGAGLVLAPLLYATVRDPKRGGWEPVATTAVPVTKAGFVEVFDLVSRKRSFWLLAFGAATSSVCGYGVAFWLPSFLTHTYFPNDLVAMSWYYAAITFVGGCLGIIGGGIVADRIGGKGGMKTRSIYARLPAFSFLLALPCFFFAVNTGSPWLALPLFIIPTGLNLVWLGPVLTAVQHLVPARMRTTASAMFLLINNLLGIAVGYSYFGAVSDAFKPHFGAESMRYALYTGLGFYVVASVLFLFAGRTLGRDWVDETTGEGVVTAPPRSRNTNIVLIAGTALIGSSLLLVALHLAAGMFTGPLPIAAINVPIVVGVALFVAALRASNFDALPRAAVKR